MHHGVFRNRRKYMHRHLRSHSHKRFLTGLGFIGFRLWGVQKSVSEPLHINPSPVRNFYVNLCAPCYIIANFSVSK